MKSICCAMLVLWAAAISCGAWGSVGHMTVAEQAWRKLDANERQNITQLLKQHPHYKEILAANIPKGVDRDEWVFLTAATWPDQIRPAKKGDPARPDHITRYNIYAHAISLPVVRESDARAVSLKNFKVETNSAEVGLSESLRVLNSKRASVHDRAVALTWVLHLVGDIHAPLHASTLVTKDKPKGTGSGGYWQVIDPSGNRTGLHTFWDALPGLEISYPRICALADKLTANPELQPLRLPEYRSHKSPMSWAKEGQQIAASFAYAEKDVQFVSSSDLSSGKVTESEVPKLSLAYASEAERIAQRRLALAGLRLTQQLKKAF